VFNTFKQVVRTCIIVYEKYPTDTKTVNIKHKIKIMKKRLCSLHYLSITKKRLGLLKLYTPTLMGTGQKPMKFLFLGNQTVHYQVHNSLPRDPYPELVECSPHPQTLNLEDKCPLMYAKVSQVVFFLQVF
jgi:hypothetical protein